MWKWEDMEKDGRYNNIFIFFVAAGNIYYYGEWWGANAYMMEKVCKFSIVNWLWSERMNDWCFSSESNSMHLYI